MSKKISKKVFFGTTFVMLIIIFFSINIITKKKIILRNQIPTKTYSEKARNSEDLFGSIDIEKDLKDEWTIQLKKNQMFYGNWEIIDLISPDYGLPTSYSGFDEDGNFKGYDYSNLLGTDIIIAPTHIENHNTLIPYIHEPLTISYPLHFSELNSNSKNNYIGYYKPETLGFFGNYYSVVHFMLPNDDNRTKLYSNFKKEITLYNFDRLYIKDANTMYISDGVLLFLIERTNIQ